MARGRKQLINARYNTEGTARAAYGFSVGNSEGGGLAFEPAGTLYRSGNTGIPPNSKIIKTLDPTDATTLQTFSGFITTFFDGLAVRPGDGLLFATGSGGVHTIHLGTSTQTTLSPGPPNGDTMSDLEFRPVTPVQRWAEQGLLCWCRSSPWQRAG